MDKKIYDAKKDGFYGVWYPCPQESRSVVILVHKVCVGRMAEGTAKWFHQQGLHTLVLGPVPEYKKEFKNGKTHKKECRQTRAEIERIMIEEMKVWKVNDTIQKKNY